MRHLAIVVLISLFVTPRGSGSTQEAETDAAMLARHAREIAVALEESQLHPSDGFDVVLAKGKRLEAVLARCSEEVRIASQRGLGPSLDTVRYMNGASPRLTGRVIRVGPGADVPSINDAAARLTGGELLLLEPGHHVLDDRRIRALADVAIVGGGADHTTFTSKRLQFGRVLMEGVTIDCDDDNFCDIRGGSIRLRDCVVRNYNSGAGGSNSMFATDAVVLLERTAFNGRDGSAHRGNLFGNALDFRGEWFCLARGCQFVDNAEISRVDGHLILDACVSASADGRAFGVMPYAGGTVLHRDSSVRISRPGPSVMPFRLLSDDIDVVRAAAQSEPAEASTESFVEQYDLRRNLPYWIGLLRYEDPRIRALAVRRIRILAGLEVEVDTTTTDRLADAGALLGAEVACAELLDWWDANRDGLVWDDDTGAYRHAPAD